MTQTTLEFAQIELNNIIPDPNQPRRYFNETQLKDLTESVAEITQQVAAQAEKREAVYNARVAAIKSQIEQLGEEE